jgi:hypothetical protein
MAKGTFDAATGRLQIQLTSPSGERLEVDERVVLDGTVTGKAMIGRFSYGASGHGQFCLHTT